jgi:hypothetical protein
METPNAVQAETPSEELQVKQAGTTISSDSSQHPILHQLHLTSQMLTNGGNQS